GQGANADTFCSRTGRSRNFVVLVTNANAIADLDKNAGTGVTTPPPGPGAPPDPGAGAERFISMDDFVTNPFVEQTQTQNLDSSGTGPPTAQQCTTDARLKGIVNYLKAIGPTDARYGNYFMRIGQRQSKGTMFYPACIPIGVVQANWREN
ncbi:MAG TPA: hypothetical protein VGV61_12485, partial [Thermoanaerobaculia bacterium]|nr:hypothetical protein [Thermoanaerobaculia bacterium]